jgi:polysaccharide transporter, PST family
LNFLPSLIERIRRNNLFKNFFALSLWQATNYLIPLITMPYMIRVIGTEKFGVVSLIQALHYYFIVFVDYGFSITSIRELSIAHDDKKKLSLIFSKTLFTKVLLLAISFILVAILILLVPKFSLDYQAYFFGFLLVIGQMLFPIWFFQGVEQMKFITYLNLFSKVIFAGCLFLFIQEQNDYTWVIPIQALGVIIAALVGIFVIVSKFGIKIVFPGRKAIVNELKLGFPVFISNFSVTAYNSSNYLILGFFGGDMIVGVFSIAEKIMSLLRQILSMLSQAVFPRVCQMAVENHSALKLFWKKLMIPFAAVLLLLCLLIAYFAPQIISLIAGENLTETIDLLRIIIWIPIIVLFNIPFFLTLLAYERKREVMRILLASSIFSILVSFCLTYHFQAVGTVTSLLITEFVITFGLLITLERNKELSILT